MVRRTLKILQQMLQDFQSVSDHFTTLRSKGLKAFKEFQVKRSSLDLFSASIYLFKVSMETTDQCMKSAQS